MVKHKRRIVLVVLLALFSAAVMLSVMSLRGGAFGNAFAAGGKPVQAAESENIINQADDTDLAAGGWGGGPARYKDGRLTFSSGANSYYFSTLLDGKESVKKAFSQDRIPVADLTTFASMKIRSSAGFSNGWMIKGDRKAEQFLIVMLAGNDVYIWSRESGSAADFRLAEVSAAEKVTNAGGTYDPASGIMLEIWTTKTAVSVWVNDVEVLSSVAIPDWTAQYAPFTLTENAVYEEIDVRVLEAVDFETASVPAAGDDVNLYQGDATVTTQKGEDKVYPAGNALDTMTDPIYVVNEGFAEPASLPTVIHFDMIVSAFSDTPETDVVGIALSVQGGVRLYFEKDGTLILRQAADGADTFDGADAYSFDGFPPLETNATISVDAVISGNTITVYSNGTKIGRQELPRAIEKATLHPYAKGAVVTFTNITHKFQKAIDWDYTEPEQPVVPDGYSTLILALNRSYDNTYWSQSKGKYEGGVLSYTDNQGYAVMSLPSQLEGLMEVHKTDGSVLSVSELSTVFEATVTQKGEALDVAFMVRGDMAAQEFVMVRIEGSALYVWHRNHSSAAQDVGARIDLNAVLSGGFTPANGASFHISIYSEKGAVTVWINDLFVAYRTVDTVPSAPIQAVMLCGQEAEVSDISSFITTPDIDLDYVAEVPIKPNQNNPNFLNLPTETNVLGSLIYQGAVYSGYSYTDGAIVNTNTTCAFGVPLTNGVIESNMYQVWRDGRIAEIPGNELTFYFEANLTAGDYGSDAGWEGVGLILGRNASNTRWLLLRVAKGGMVYLFDRTANTQAEVASFNTGLPFNTGTTRNVKLQLSSSAQILTMYINGALVFDHIDISKNAENGELPAYYPYAGGVFENNAGTISDMVFSFTEEVTLSAPAFSKYLPNLVLKAKGVNDGLFDSAVSAADAVQLTGGTIRFTSAAFNEIFIVNTAGYDSPNVWQALTYGGYKEFAQSSLNSLIAAKITFGAFTAADEGEAADSWQGAGILFRMNADTKEFYALQFRQDGTLVLVDEAGTVLRSATVKAEALAEADSFDVTVFTSAFSVSVWVNGHLAMDSVAIDEMNNVFGVWTGCNSAVYGDVSYQLSADVEFAEPENKDETTYPPDPELPDANTDSVEPELPSRLDEYRDVETTSYTWAWIGGGIGVVAIAAALIAYFVIRMKRNKKLKEEA